MMRPTDILVEEHDVIKRMLTILKKASNKLERGEDVEADVFLDAADFIKNFADHCHHAKEENLLFKQMGERGVPMKGGPIGMMILEHERAREYTKGLTDAAKRLSNGDDTAKDEVISNARHYVELLTQHIFKENNILYPLGNQSLTEEDQDFLREEFERIEHEEIGEGVHHKYIKMVEELENTFHLAK